jgi:hypothetical protein
MGKVKTGGIITGAVFAIMIIIILWGGFAKTTTRTGRYFSSLTGLWLSRTSRDGI